MHDNTNRYCGKQIGNYQIIRCIGEGRFGICFLAEENGQNLILKKYKPNIFKRNTQKNDYEIWILSQLNHRAIPRLLGIVNFKGFCGIALEHKCGDTLESMLFKQKHRFSPDQIFLIGNQLIEIIKYIHERGIVHRDIRIPNVLIDGDSVYLVDFGLARMEDKLQCTRDMDFSFFGDLLLYLLYSTYQKETLNSHPWYHELTLSPGQTVFLKRLLKFAEPYRHIDEIAKDFRDLFHPGHENISNCTR